MASDPVVLPTVHLFLQKQHLPTSSTDITPPSLLTAAGRLLFSGGGCGRSHGRRSEMLNYLKPGALARLRDARIRRSPGCTSRKRKLFEPAISSASEVQSSDEVNPMSATVCPPEVFRSFGPSYPQRKKLLASKVSDFSTPSASASSLSSALPRFVQQSSLESLPFTLLVYILSKLQRDDQRASFFVSKRLRHAVTNLSRTT